MATRSNVAIMYSESKCKSIYIHNGGEPKSIGETLFNHYQDLQKIEKAISLGNASALLEEIETSVFYCRDWKRHEEKEAFEGTLQQIQDRMIDYDTEYLYVYDVQNKQWLYKHEGEMSLQPLKNVFKQ